MRINPLSSGDGNLHVELGISAQSCEVNAKVTKLGRSRHSRQEEES